MQKYNNCIIDTTKNWTLEVTKEMIQIRPKGLIISVTAEDLKGNKTEVLDIAVHVKKEFKK